MKIYIKIKWRINIILNCLTYNVVYNIVCDNDYCKKIYIEDPKRPVKHLIADHRGCIVNKQIDKATGAHFNSAGRSLRNMNFTILGKVKMNNDNYKKERGKYLINKLNIYIYYRGLNRKKLFSV